MIPARQPGWYRGADASSLERDGALSLGRRCERGTEPFVREADAEARPSGHRARGARSLGPGAHPPAPAGAQPRRAHVQLHRRPRHREQSACRPYRVGTDAEGRVPALQGDAGLRSALPERIRLSGTLDRGGSRTRARAELEKRDRVVWLGGVRSEVPAEGHLVGRRTHKRQQTPRPVDGLGQRLLHVLRHEH